MSLIRCDDKRDSIVLDAAAAYLQWRVVEKRGVLAQPDTTLFFTKSEAEPIFVLSRRVGAGFLLTCNLMQCVVPASPAIGTERYLRSQTILITEMF